MKTCTFVATLRYLRYCSLAQRRLQCGSTGEVWNLVWQNHSLYTDSRLLTQLAACGVRGLFSCTFAPAVCFGDSRARQSWVMKEGQRFADALKCDFDGLHQPSTCSVSRTILFTINSLHCMLPECVSLLLLLPLLQKYMCLRAESEGLLNIFGILPVHMKGMCAAAVLAQHTSFRWTLEAVHNHYIFKLLPVFKVAMSTDQGR